MESILFHLPGRVIVKEPRIPSITSSNQSIHYNVISSRFLPAGTILQYEFIQGDSSATHSSYDATQPIFNQQSLCGESAPESTPESPNDPESLNSSEQASSSSNDDPSPNAKLQCESDCESYVILDSEMASPDDSSEQKHEEKRRPNAFKNGVERFKKIGLSSIFKSFTSNFRNQPEAHSKNLETDQSDDESGFNSEEERLEVPSEILTNTESNFISTDVPVISKTEGHEKDKSTDEPVEDERDQKMDAVENAQEVVADELSDSEIHEPDHNNSNKRKINWVDLVTDGSNSIPSASSIVIVGPSEHPPDEQKYKKAKKLLVDDDRLSIHEIQSEDPSKCNETVPKNMDIHSSKSSKPEVVQVNQSSSDREHSNDDESPSQSPKNMNDSVDESRELESDRFLSVCRNDDERMTSESSSSSCDNLNKKRRSANGFDVAGLSKRAAFTVVAIEKGWKQDGDRSHAIFQNIYKDFGKHQDKIHEIVIEKNYIKVYTDHRDTRLLLMQELKEINAIINETSPFQLDVQNPLKPSIQFLVQDTIYNLSCSEFLSQLRRWNNWDDEWTVHVESKEWIRKIRKGKISLIVDARIRDKLETEDLIIKIDQVPVKVFDKFGITQCSVCLRFGHAKCRSRIRCFFCSGCHPDKIRHDKYNEQRFCFLCRASGHTPIAKNCPSLIAEIQSKLELIDYEYSDIFLGNDRSY